MFFKGFPYRLCLFFFLSFLSYLHAQSSPLIMKRADRLSVARNRGNLVLEGRVHFVHDSIEFKTQRAVWNRDVDMVQCDGHFIFTHPDGFIRASSGVYQKKSNFASATGKVVAKDSAGTYAFYGEHLNFDRNTGILLMPDQPVLEQYEVQGDSIDTLTIKASRIIYNKEDEFASAFEKVNIQKKNMLVTADSAYFDRKNNWIALSGNPVCQFENETVKGDSIYLELEENSQGIRSALVIRNAYGIQKQPAKGKQKAQITEAFGDTLYVQFKNGELEMLYVNLNAKGIFFEEDLKDYKNLMDGNRLDIYFNKGKIDRAFISGAAKSTYFYVKEDRSVVGKNESMGDTIQVYFDKGQVSSLKMMGGSTKASGRYFDLEKQGKNKVKKHE